jgi:hypothetical protein
MLLHHLQGLNLLSRSVLKPEASFRIMSNYFLLEQVTSLLQNPLSRRTRVPHYMSIFLLKPKHFLRHPVLSRFLYFAVGVDKLCSAVWTEIFCY